MLVEATPLEDEICLARSLRVLALRARQILRSPADAAETRDLLLAIANLESDTRVHSATDVARWLSSLRRRIEKHTRPSA